LARLVLLDHLLVDFLNLSFGQWLLLAGLGEVSRIVHWYVEIVAILTQVLFVLGDLRSTLITLSVIIV